MIRVIGVRFRNVGKVYYFSPQDFDIYTGDHVIVETARGVEYGTVVLAPRDVEEDKIVQPLKDVLRVATPEDDEQEAANRVKEKEAFQICLEKIRNHELDMKLIDAEYTFDNNKVLFYFTADGRIDFRELVKDLAAVFKTRIELRQIGVRDETKILGGIGICGRPLCCHTYLSEFAPVSIKMAKEQNLSLNPTKISGTCGRLMCCLKNEQETYEYLNSRLPAVGDRATTPDGLKGEVQSVSVLRQTVKVLVEVEKDEVELQEFKVDELTFQMKSKKEKARKEAEKEAETLSEEIPEEVAELELLEEKELVENKTPERKKKPYGRKFSDRNNSGKNNSEKGDSEKVTLEKNNSEKNSSEKNNSEKSSFEKNSSEKPNHERRHYERRSGDRRPRDRYSEKNAEKNIDRNSEKNSDRNTERNTERSSERNSERNRYRKYKDRGREKQHDSNVTSE